MLFKKRTEPPGKKTGSTEGGKYGSWYLRMRECALDSANSPKHSGSPGHLKCCLASLTRVLGQGRGRLSPLPTVAYHERNECVYGCAGNTSE